MTSCFFGGNVGGWPDPPVACRGNPPSNLGRSQKRKTIWSGFPLHSTQRVSSQVIGPIVVPKILNGPQPGKKRQQNGQRSQCATHARHLSVESAHEKCPWSSHQLAEHAHHSIHRGATRDTRPKSKSEGTCVRRRKSRVADTIAIARFKAGRLRNLEAELSVASITRSTPRPGSCTLLPSDRIEWS